MKRMLASVNFPIQQIISRIEENRDTMISLIKSKNTHWRCIYIYLLICYKIINIDNNDNIICKKFNLKPLYFNLCMYVVFFICGIL